MNTPRRRFFPSTSAQQLPARSVELEMQLRPLAPPAAPTQTTATGTGDEPTLPSWMDPVPFSVAAYTWLVESTMEDGRILVQWEGDHSDWWSAAVYDGVPVVRMPPEVYHLPAKAGMQPLMVPSPGWRLIELAVGRPEHSNLFIGACFGSRAKEVQWETSWDQMVTTDDGSAAYTTETHSGTLIVTLRGVYGDITPATLTATAMLDGKSLGILKLMVSSGY